MSNATVTVRMSKDKWSILVYVGGAKMGEYRADKNIRAEMASIRRAVKKHLANGGTANNYPW